MIRSDKQAELESGQMRLLRVWADISGETHLTPIDLPAIESPVGSTTRFGLGDIPTTTLTIGRLAERKFDQGWHTPPRRQIVVVLRGALEVTTTTGDCQRFGPGDCLLADDLDSKGHITRDVGDEQLATLTIGIPGDWEIPPNTLATPTTQETMKST
jgi:hypothetical protein